MIIQFYISLKVKKYELLNYYKLEYKDIINPIVTSVTKKCLLSQEQFLLLE